MILLFIVLLIICAGVAYYIGRKSEKQAVEAQIEAIPQINMEEAVRQFEEISEKTRYAATTYEEMQRSLDNVRRAFQNISQQIEVSKAVLAETNERIADAANHEEQLIKERQASFEAKLENACAAAIAEANQKYNDQLMEYQDEYDSIYDFYTDKICELQGTLDEYHAKQEAINNELLAAEQREKEKEKYTLVISDSDWSDIQYLLDLSRKLNKVSTLRKFVWSEYIISAFNKMIKLQFGGKVPKNVIYMIECGDKKYIGKTQQEISKRWTDHIKSALEIDGAATQQIHQVMMPNLRDIRFSVLEEVGDKDKLLEREKYYIQFYGTDKYGYNMIK